VFTGYQLYKSDREPSSSFEPFVLVKKEPVSTTASIFHLEPQSTSNLDLYREAWKRGIWNCQFKQPQIQVVRAYTPLPPISDDNLPSDSKSSLRFLIRKERNGEVSGWLHRLPLGSALELRGPNIEHEISPETANVLFLAGGTGIASALQAAHALLRQTPATPSDPHVQPHQPKISILWASRLREDCEGAQNPILDDHNPSIWSSWSSWLVPRSSNHETLISATTKGPIVKELEALQAQYPSQVSVTYFVDSEKKFIDPKAVIGELATFHSLGKNDARSTTGETEIIISGPEGFIKYLAGPKEWRNGREEQGPLQGVVAQVLAGTLHDVRVWKV
jgi:ferredoxin-NADP reductase